MADTKELDAAFPAQAEVDTAFPAKGQPSPSPAPATNAVQQAKDWLLRAPPEGQRHGIPGLTDIGPDLGQYVRKGAEYILPGSWPGLMSMGVAAAVPGAGVLPALGRIGLSSGAGAGVEAIRGGDPLLGAVEGGVGAASGEMLAGAGRAIGRKISSAMGPESLTDRLGQFIGGQVPAYQGASGAETVRKILSGEGQQALSQEYRQRLSSALSGLPAGTYVQVPALESLGQQGGVKGMPGLFEPADALTKIQSLQRSLQTMTGDTTRRKMALSEMSLLERAEQELTAGIQRVAQGSPVAQELAAASAEYAKGKSLMRLLTGGREGMTRSQSERFLQGTDFERGQQIEMNYLRQRGDLGAKLPADAASTLDELVRRGETLPLAVSQPGTAPTVNMRLGHIGGMPVPMPTSHGILPHAPRPIGATVPDATADVLRLLGIGGISNSLPRPPGR